MLHTKDMHTYSEDQCTLQAGDMKFEEITQRTMLFGNTGWSYRGISFVVDPTDNQSRGMEQKIDDTATPHSFPCPCCQAPDQRTDMGLTAIYCLVGL